MDVDSGSANQLLPESAVYDGDAWQPWMALVFKKGVCGGARAFKWYG